MRAWQSGGGGCKGRRERHWHSGRGTHPLAHAEKESDSSIPEN